MKTRPQDQVYCTAAWICRRWLSVLKMALVEGEKGESKLSGRIKAKKLGSRRFFKAKVNQKR